MARGFNQVTLMGNLTRDPEMRTIPSGQTVCNFSLAVNRSYTGKDGNAQDQVDYIDCVAWGKPAEIISQYMKKGSKMMVAGRLQTRSYEDKTGNKRKAVDVVVSDFNFLDSAGGGGQQGRPNNQSQQSEQNNNKQDDEVIQDLDTDQPIDLSEIPF